MPPASSSAADCCGPLRSQIHGIISLEDHQQSPSLGALAIHFLLCEKASVRAHTGEGR